MAEDQTGAAAAVLPESAGSRVRTDWTALVAAWKASGQSQTRFCRERGLSRYQFGQWKAKLEGRDRRGGARLVKVAGLKAGAARGLGGLRLSVGGCYTVEVPAGFDAETLGRLLELPEGR